MLDKVKSSGLGLLTGDATVLTDHAAYVRCDTHGDK